MKLEFPMAHIQAFQSRNRGSFHFKGIMRPGIGVRFSRFQSRNRGSFHFKYEQ
jgi:hypothetical protein